MDLNSELTSRSHDDDPCDGVPAIAMQEPLDDSDPEGDRLSTSRPRRGDDVLSQHGDRNAFALDGGRGRELERGEGEEEGSGEGAVGEGVEGRRGRGRGVGGEVSLGSGSFCGGGVVGVGGRDGALDSDLELFRGVRVVRVVHVLVKVLECCKSSWCI
jgi:hypothetical protein